MAFTTGNRARLLFGFRDLSVATCTHSMVCLPQGAFGWVQIGLEPEAGLILVARRTLDALGVFFKLRLIHNVLSTFEAVVALAAFDTRIIQVSQMRKFNRGPATISEYRLVIQHNIFWLSVQIDRPQEASDAQNQHANQKMSPSHGCSPRLVLSY